MLMRRKLAGVNRELAVLVLEKPLVGVVVVHQKSSYGKHHISDEQSFVVVEEQGVADTYAEGYARLPAEEIHAL